MRDSSRQHKEMPNIVRTAHQIELPRVVFFRKTGNIYHNSYDIKRSHAHYEVGRLQEVQR